MFAGWPPKSSAASDFLYSSFAGEALTWRRGEALVFDDSYVHETWNRTAADRVVLLFDVWHPGLGDDEVGAVVDMFRRAAKPK